MPETMISVDNFIKELKAQIEGLPYLDGAELRAQYKQVGDMLRQAAGDGSGYGSEKVREAQDLVRQACEGPAAIRRKSAARACTEVESLGHDLQATGALKLQHQTPDGGC